jgi:sugar lactone lactonase YvrE
VFIGPALLPTAGTTGIHVSRLVYPAPFLKGIDGPTGDAWTIPADAVTVGDDTFVLDTGNNRIFRLARDGATLATFGTQLDSANTLQLPMAIATDGKRLFVANSMGAEVLVLDLSGKVTKTIALPAGVSGKVARPIGIATTADGGLVVADANNDQVLRLDAHWNIVWTAGTGTRAGGSEGFNVPGAVTVDDNGNVYVVDTLGARVVELSPAGAFLRQFGERGDTVGKLSRPKGVAVDAHGRVFVSDGLLAAIEVFAPDGGYLGIIGRRDPSKVNSTSLFVAPAGLSITPDALTVTDRYAGVLTFDLTGKHHAATIPTQAPNVASPTPGYVGTPVHSH